MFSPHVSRPKAVVWQPSSADGSRGHEKHPAASDGPALLASLVLRCFSGPAHNTAEQWAVAWREGPWSSQQKHNCCCSLSWPICIYSSGASSLRGSSITLCAPWGRTAKLGQHGNLAKCVMLIISYRVESECSWTRLLLSSSSSYSFHSTGVSCPVSSIVLNWFCSYELSELRVNPASLARCRFIMHVPAILKYPRLLNR